MPLTAFTNLGQNLMAATTLVDVMALVENDRVEQVDLQSALRQRLVQGSVGHDHDVESAVHRLKEKENNLRKIEAPQPTAPHCKCRH